MFFKDSIVVVRHSGKRGKVLDKFINTDKYLVEVEDDVFLRVLSEDELKQNEGIELPSYDYI